MYLFLGCAVAESGDERRQDSVKVFGEGVASHTRQERQRSRVHRRRCQLRRKQHVSVMLCKHQQEKVQLYIVYKCYSFKTCVGQFFNLTKLPLSLDQTHLGINHTEMYFALQCTKCNKKKPQGKG